MPFYLFCSFIISWISWPFSNWFNSNTIHCYAVVLVKEMQQKWEFSLSGHRRKKTLCISAWSPTLCYHHEKCFLWITGPSVWVSKWIQLDPEWSQHTFKEPSPARSVPQSKATQPSHVYISSPQLPCRWVRLPWKSEGSQSHNRLPSPWFQWQEEKSP